MGQTMTIQAAFERAGAGHAAGQLPHAPLAMPKQVLEGPSFLRLMRRRFLRLISADRTARVGMGR